MRSALLKVPGVIQADVSMPDKAVVKIDKTKKVTTAQLIDAVKKAGYGAKLKEEKKKGSS